MRIICGFRAHADGRGHIAIETVYVAWTPTDA